MFAAVELLESSEDYTLKEVTLCIKTESRRSIGSRTLHRWRDRLGIRPNKHGTYSEKQVDALVSLASWTAAGRKIDQFIDRHYEELRIINV